MRITQQVTAETLFNEPRQVIVHLDGREYSGSVERSKKHMHLAVVVWLSQDGFDRREFTIGAVVYAIQQGSWLYG